MTPNTTDRRETIDPDELELTTLDDWWVEGSYFEACNCDAVCPCQQQGDREDGRSTYGICDFALTRRIERGEADGGALDGFEVVLVGRYLDDEPGVPDGIALYIDERADSDQYHALTHIFLGRAGCANLECLEQTIDMYAVRPACIRLNHTPDNQRVAVEDYVTNRTPEPVDSEETISCGILGHDLPGTEYRIEVLRVDEPPLCWGVTGKTGSPRSSPTTPHESVSCPTLPRTP